MKIGDIVLWHFTGQQDIPAIVTSVHADGSLGLALLNETIPSAGEGSDVGQYTDPAAPVAPVEPPPAAAAAAPVAAVEPAPAVHDATHSLLLQLAQRLGLDTGSADPSAAPVSAPDAATQPYVDLADHQPATDATAAPEPTDAPPTADGEAGA